MVDDRLEERLRTALRVTGGELHLSVTTAELERRLRMRRRSRTVQRSLLIAAGAGVVAFGLVAVSASAWLRTHPSVAATTSPPPEMSTQPEPSPSVPAVVPPSAESSGPIQSPDWTRVPLTVRYWTDGDGFAYEIGADGSGNHRVPAFDRDMDLPAPSDSVPTSSDGRFRIEQRDGVDGIFTADGRLVTEVPGADRGQIIAASWSPTANLVVVARSKGDGHFTPGWAWVLDADHAGTLAGPLDTGTQRDWAWSPDGRSVAVSAVDGLRIVDGIGGTVAVYRSPIAGVSGYVALDWSPDGRSILFLPWSPGKNEIDRVAADGTGAKRLSLGWTPAWSSDSSKIAYVRSPTADGGGPDWQVWTMNANGTDRRILVKDGCPCAAPEWAPNDSLILVQEGNELWVVAPDGASGRRLARNAVGTWVTEAP